MPNGKKCIRGRAATRAGRAVACGAVILLAVVAQSVSADAPPSREFSRHRVQSIAPPVTASGTVRIPVALDGAQRILRLEPVDVRAADFTVFVQNARGRMVEVTPPSSRTWRGEIEGLPGTRVGATLRQGKVAATIIDEHGDLWHVQPMSDLSATAAADQHAVYRASDVLPDDTACGVSPLEGSTGIIRAARDGGGTAGTSLKVCAVAFDADVEYYQLNGSSVAATVNDIEDIMNQVAVIYEGQASLTFEITTIFVRTSEPDPFSSTNSDTLLNQFAAEWNSNMQGVHRDTAHLFTGKDIDGTVIGAAYTGAICEVCGAADGYGYSQSRFSPNIARRVALTAHELGHTLGANHCDGDSTCGIMCSQNGGCNGSLTEFGSFSLSQIASGVNSASCLSNLADPVSLPFCDRFDATVSSSLWSYNASASISAAAVNPPSGPNVLALNGCCTPCANAPDDIRSNFVQLAGANHATFSYYTEHGGGANTAGAQMIVEYWNVAGDWVEVNRLTATGVAQSSFTRWSHQLPADAFHSDFRIRFRLASALNQPTWFVDDVSVIDIQAELPVLFVSANALGGGTGASWGSAYNDLQQALSVARCSAGVIEEIWVAEGTYYPDRGFNDRASSFVLGNNLRLLGGFAGYETSSDQRDPVANVTVLSGNIGSGASVTDNCFHVVTAGGTDATAVLDGFTISGGNANGSGSNNAGGGIWNVTGGPTIRHCVIRDNRGSSSGGMHNTAGATPVLEDCTFANNIATSVSGGAMSNTLGSVVTIDRGTFFANRATANGGAIHNSSSSLAASNTVFVGNISVGGAAINNSSSSAELTGCTLASNVATVSGGGIFNIGSGTTIRNSVLWGNTDSTGASRDAQVDSSATVEYSCVQDSLPGDFDVFPGTGNIDLNPQFLVTPNDGGDGWGVGNNDNPGDLRVALGSPVLDAGDPGFSPPNGAADRAGGPRVLCAAVDMGAYEAGVLDPDCDGDTDAADVALWPACFTGPYGGPVGTGCDAFDVEVDDDVDLRDWSSLQSRFAE